MPIFVAMKTKQQKYYLAPEVEVLETVVELGFIGSGNQQLPEYDEDDDVITIG